jgi:hypothetical protein
MNRVAAIFLSTTVMAGATMVHAEETAPTREVKRVEIGTGLVAFSVTSTAGDHVSSFGMPSDTFFTPGPLAYAAFNVSPKVAVEGQVGLTVVSFDHNSGHFLTLAAQLDYLFKGDAVSSPYAFVRARVDNSGSDRDATHTGLGGGIGYRLRAGDRAVVRFDGRYDHFSGGDAASDFIGISRSDVFSIALSIGVRL